MSDYTFLKWSTEWILKEVALLNKYLVCKNNIWYWKTFHSVWAQLQAKLDYYNKNHETIKKLQ